MIHGPPDANLSLQAAVTKIASFDSVGLDLGAGRAVDPPGQPMVGAVSVTALDFTTGDETYKFTLQESADNITFTNCGAQISATAIGLVYVPGFVQKRYVRISLVEAGTTPSLTYSATLAPLPL
jgi:hypothetical protein